MDYDVDKKADELLEALGKELMKSREQYADRILEGEEVSLYKEEAVKQHGHHRTFRRMIILVAVLVMLMGLAIVSVDGVREKVFNYFLSDNPGNTEITPLGNAEGNVLPEAKLEYLPNGYNLVSSDEKENIGIWMSYRKAEEQFIEFSMCRSDYYSPSVDNDTMEHEQVRINVYQAQLFSDEQDCYLVWQAGDYTLSLYGNLDKDTVIKIADHVRLSKS